MGTQEKDALQSCPCPDALLSEGAWKGQNNTNNEKMSKRQLSLTILFYKAVFQEQSKLKPKHETGNVNYECNSKLYLLEQ